MIALLVAVPLLPLAAGLAALVRWRAASMGGWLVALATGTSLALLMGLYDEYLLCDIVWLRTSAYRLEVGLALDSLTWLMASVVAAVGCLVAIYAIGYMAGEPRRARFFAVLGSFIGAMLVLVLASSLVMLFIAWEAVGVASYLLIGFHERDPAAQSAAMRAFLMTRIGDMGLLLAWLMVLLAFGTTDIASVLGAIEAGDSADWAGTIALFALAATIGKSAQLPLTAWLPDAMAAPTPVSALLHSATMVAAGVYLLLRLHPLFAATSFVLVFIACIGAASALVAALIATAARDLKRLLAWSTVSQLGEMLLAVGLGAPLAAVAQLVAHAAFKATLFAGAGAIDRATGTRELDKLGGLARKLPITAFAFTIGALFLTGMQAIFFPSSHEALLDAARHAGNAGTALVLVLLLLAGIYIGRAWACLFTGPGRSPSHATTDVNRSMKLGLFALATLTIVLGFASGTLDRFLSFAPIDQSGASRGLAILASLAGLAFGIARARRSGAAPALGRWPLALAQAIAALPTGVAAGVDTLARALVPLEAGIDRAAAGLVHGISRIARGGTKLDARLGVLEERAVAATWRAAALDQSLEARFFGAGGDAFAHALAAGGERVRYLQSGKLYLYTLGVSLWVLAIIVAAVAVLVSG